MTEYDLGTLIIMNHDVEKLTEALDIPNDRFDGLVDLAWRAWKYENTISESIEFIAKNSSGSELVLTLVFFGRIWEEQQGNAESTPTE
ncbi:MAG: hypothetical protein DRO87_08295 [Candidatus Thorarchaeota archaeon]|nr:MAG: hypothetical protein DRO87_08295 [Candidatus Thorarchaeota archaeon]